MIRIQKSLSRVYQAILDWFFAPSCVVYVGCRMTGRDRLEMVNRAVFVCDVLRRYGLTPISPVLEELVPPLPGNLINNNTKEVEGFWRRDKWILRRVARVNWLDYGNMKSFGMEREYCLSRGVLWKPTVMIVPHGTPLSVAPYEDDVISDSVHCLAKEVRDRWGSRWNYWKWRIQMLNRSLPGWILDQIWAWA